MRRTDDTVGVFNSLAAAYGAPPKSTYTDYIMDAAVAWGAC